MPGDDCGPCKVKVVDAEGQTHEVDGACCGSNALNADPRPAIGPSWSFIQTGYQCEMDGWRQVACKADMCCVHPDDLPAGGTTVTPGTTCQAQGWWYAWEAQACENAAGFAHVTPVCVKKEICGAGQCQPWPNYCWKLPNTSGGGGGGGGGDDPTDPPPGVTCSSKSWYDGDKLSDCERDHTICVRKQDCDGQTCLPYPYYCWKPE
jgi:hypothetical protein